ncbi:MAG TPA: radical SAM family heme chaperone HemW [Pyrinomonadaceae bacterium]|jgi:oxygen-independent coproporphyrinogen-3 oxidase|nr:radical SAM family heme chaperone HemW [Pyrinomonadaceae bacterium]
MTAAGLYVHIPFCSSRCSYCDFATGLYQTELAERYVGALIEEIKTSRHVGASVDTVYFGGGTPSLLAPAQLDRILATLSARFEIDPASEITLEINPGSVTREKLAAFRSLGINRASFGAQTFDDHELAKLGRSHNAADALQTFSDLRDAGFTNISFDLIAGLPGQTLAGWQRNIKQALELNPEHLSFYLLEVHSGTPLAEHIRRGLQPVPDDDLAGEMYQWMLDEASEAGYEHYEISNLCRPGFNSRHNVKYWTTAPYYGFGCSAHSYDGRTRRWSNHRDVLKYVEMIEGGKSPVAERHELSEADVRAEALFLGMRLMRGVDVRHYRESFGVDLREAHAADLDRFRDAGLLEFDGDMVRLTRTGALLSNEVFAAFV